VSCGALVLVVGPSGAGKDSLIAGARERLAGDARFIFSRRVVTRPPTAYENHDTTTPDEFAALFVSGRFALHWQAHGLSYGLPQEVIEQAEAGAVVVCNVSRGIVAPARAQFGKVAAVYVDAQPELRKARIAARGRDAPSGSRVDQSRAELTPAACEFVIDNSGALETAVNAFTSVLLAIAEDRTHA